MKRKASPKAVSTAHPGDSAESCIAGKTGEKSEIGKRAKPGDSAPTSRSAARRRSGLGGGIKGGGDRADYAAKSLPGSVTETPFEGIGVYSESGLHASLKLHYAGENTRFEVALEGRIVDLVREVSGEEELVEVQTRRLDKIAPKVLSLALGHKVRIIHPISVETTIVRLSPDTGEVISERKSPKRGDLWSVFDELVRAPSLIGARNVVLEVLFVRCREVRRRDGGGSWRRRGDSILSRDLDAVVESKVFSKPSHWLALIPEDCPSPWTSKSLGQALGIGAERARKLLYSYARAGLLVECGKQGRLKAYGPLRPTRQRGKKPRVSAEKVGTAT
jgi:hypothetical protein